LAIVLIPLVALLVFLAVALGGLAQVWQAFDGLLSGELVIRSDQSAVVTQIQSLSRLETASYTVEKVIEGGVSQGNPLLNAILGDRLLFIAHGEVIAGVDLGHLEAGDVVVGEESVSVRLPPAQILSSRLDNAKSRVYDRQQGLLAPRNPNLETEVRLAAEREILQAACEGGILDQARMNAETQVAVLLRSFGHSRVEFLPSRPLSDIDAPTGC
jgi:hypothetical protein